MKNNRINLIGLNLYSIFLALKIRQIKKDIPITIIDGSKNFLNAYNKIKINKYSVNPGFHSFEDIRSKNIINFLGRFVKFNKIIKTRGILIGDKLMSWLDGHDQWPGEILEKYKIKKEKITIDPNKDLSLLNKNYLRYLIDNCDGDKVKIQSVINSAYPWFFPKNYNVSSEDEGALFNKKIREGKVKHAFVFPEGSLFYNISKQLKKNLKKNNINIKLNFPIRFQKSKKLITLKNQNKQMSLEAKNIVCVPVIPLIKSIDDINDSSLLKSNLKPIKYYTGLIEIKNSIQNNLDKFCEIIVSSEFAFGLKRISNYSEASKIKKKLIYQIEFIEHINNRDVNIQINDIIKLLSKFIVFKNHNKSNNISLIGYSFVRNIFRPKESEIKRLSLKTIKYFENQENFIFPRQITWPINSNKHFLFAEEDFKIKVRRFIND